MTHAIAKPKVSDVRQWITALGVLTAGNTTRAEAEMKLRAYVPLLQTRFPPAAFTQASLEAVASQCRFFPAYGDVVTHLAAWWHEHRPAPPRLPPPAPEPERPPPTPEELAYIHERVQEVVASLRSSRFYSDEQPQRLDEATTTSVRPRYLSPEQLDQLNPLPNGRKRTRADEAAIADPVPAASLDPDPYAEDCGVEASSADAA